MQLLRAAHDHSMQLKPKPKPGLEKADFVEGVSGTKYSILEMKLADLAGFVEKLKPGVVLYCPRLCDEGLYGAMIAGIPSVSLNTVAGPGATPSAYKGMTAMDGLTGKELFDWGQSYAPRIEAMAMLERKYSLSLVKNKLPQPAWAVAWHSQRQG